jgi:hypothetical protein
MTIALSQCTPHITLDSITATESFCHSCGRALFKQSVWFLTCEFVGWPVMHGWCCDDWCLMWRCVWQDLHDGSFVLRHGFYSNVLIMHLMTGSIWFMSCLTCGSYCRSVRSVWIFSLLPIKWLKMVSWYRDPFRWSSDVIFWWQPILWFPYLSVVCAIVLIWLYTVAVWCSGSLKFEKDTPSLWKILVSFWHKDIKMPANWVHIALARSVQCSLSIPLAQAEPKKDAPRHFDSNINFIYQQI